MSLVLVVLIMTSNPIGHPYTVQAAFARVQPDNTYLPTTLDVPQKMVAIP